MKQNLITRFLRSAAFNTIAASILLVAVPIQAEAAGKPLSCSISPDGGSTVVGVAIKFSGMTRGGKRSKSYSWEFSDGAGVPAA